jgi:hypothetical protein
VFAEEETVVVEEDDDGVVERLVAPQRLEDLLHPSVDPTQRLKSTPIAHRQPADRLGGQRRRLLHERRLVVDVMLVERGRLRKGLAFEQALVARKRHGRVLRAAPAPAVAAVWREVVRLQVQRLVARALVLEVVADQTHRPARHHPRLVSAGLIAVADSPAVDRQVVVEVARLAHGREPVGPTGRHPSVPASALVAVCVLANVHGAVALSLEPHRQRVVLPPELGIEVRRHAVVV